jgi:hypothetical protein
MRGDEGALPFALSAEFVSWAALSAGLSLPRRSARRAGLCGMMQRAAASGRVRREAGLPK